MHVFFNAVIILVKMVIFWGVKPCSQGTLKMEATGSSEMVLIILQTVCHIPEYCNPERIIIFGLCIHVQQKMLK
jgi:hypothetical protein